MAREVGSFLHDRWNLRKADIRLFFSGRKGLNFEIRPTGLGIVGDLDAQMRTSERLQSELKDGLTAEGMANYIDRVYGAPMFWLRPRHPFVRLHDSVNSWRSGGVEYRRRKTEVSLEDLFTLDIDAIVEKSFV